MANRHLSRSIVLQTLFEWDFNDKDKSDNPAEVLERNAKEFAQGVSDISFMRRLLINILEKKEEIDRVIVKSAPEWPIDKISNIDRNVLRIGLYELIYGDKIDVPAKVAINEAIELAKTFGGESSGKFVNGVLGTVYKEIGGGSNTNKDKRNVAPIDISKLPVKVLGGAVVYSKVDNDIYLAFVHDIFGHWTLSKGHLENGEDEEKGVERAVGEELGIKINIKEKLGSNEYVASHPEKGKMRKQVVYFLAEALFEELNLEKTGGLDDARWFKITDILDLNIYDDILPLITKAVNILLKK